jgi:hypothetical protein
MPYVMVPVPEEYVEEVMQFVLRSRARESITYWSAEEIAALYAEVDEPTRSLLAYAARASLSGSDLPETEAARRIELTQREVLGILRELNDRARDLGRPTIIGRKSITEALPSGRTADVRVFYMADDVAAMVHEVERADLAASMPSSVGAGE